MKYLFCLFFVSALLGGCKKSEKPVSGEVANPQNDSIVDNFVVDSVKTGDGHDLRVIKDIDSISVTSKVAEIQRSVGNNHFSLRIELPHYDDGAVDRNILTWINRNLEDVIRDSLDYNVDNNINDDFQEYQMTYNQKYEGNLSDIKSLLRFYADKHFIIYNGDRLGVEYNIDCRKVFENKDIVSFEITEFFSNYAIMKTRNLVRGASFFKYNGQLLSWPFFEKSNVKNIVKKEINRQYLKFSQDAYEEFLKTTRFGEFSLPDNPPYMTRTGLKFIYRLNELSPKVQDGQISCIVSPDNISLMSSLLDMLR